MINIINDGGVSGPFALSVFRGESVYHNYRSPYILVASKPDFLNS